MKLINDIEIFLMRLEMFNYSEQTKTDALFSRGYRSGNFEKEIKA